MTNDKLGLLSSCDVSVVKPEAPTIKPETPTAKPETPSVVPLASSVVPLAKTYLVAIPPKYNFSVTHRWLKVNDQEPIGLPLDQPEVMIELDKPTGQNHIAIEDWCLTNLVRNIPTTM